MLVFIVDHMVNIVLDVDEKKKLAWLDFQKYGFFPSTSKTPGKSLYGKRDLYGKNWQILDEVWQKGTVIHASSNICQFLSVFRANKDKYRNF